ncbi:MAG TPA: MBL fold metallo-hydrolase [Candidatus Anoxymicrobiaceae bacterium]
MKVHYLNCGTFRPRFIKKVLGPLADVPSVCLLLQDGDRLMLVDSGLGTRDMKEPGRLGFPNLMLNAVPDVEQTAARQIEGMGLDPGDVTDIICTHLDSDHAGGLSDFPDARVHVSQVEHDAACGEKRSRRPAYRGCHFDHYPKWITYKDPSGEDWFGMECIRGLEGLPAGLVLVPLPGHTKGQCGVAVETDDGWLLHCGDAFYAADELEHPPAAVRFFARLAHDDPRSARLQLGRIKKVIAEGKGAITVMASHDRQGFDRLTGD